MIVLLRQSFTKQYRKLRVNEQARCSERLNLFAKDPSHPLLRDHRLASSFRNLRSINVGGDLRALYRKINEETVQFVGIGTHSDLYE